MTVSELKDKLEEIEAEGKGDYKVTYFDELRHIEVYDNLREVELDEDD